MESKTAYGRYAGDRTHMADYAAYQQRYATSIRESDRVLIELVAECADASASDPVSVLDIGCSTGNLLRHLRARLGQPQLHGADLADDVIEACCADSDLAGIEFSVLDVVADAPEGHFDVITANALFFVFDQAQLERAVANIHGALKPGGALVCFDLLHPFDQELTVNEVSGAHPEGLQLVLRSHRAYERAVVAAGFSEPEFHPFTMPFALERSPDPSVLTTYTEQTTDGRHLSFRGALTQPWCHAVARA